MADEICAREERRVREQLAATPGDPKLTFLLAIALLRQGRYAEGFPLLAVRRQVPEVQGKTGLPFPRPRWNGEDLAGKKLLVAGVEGYGDQIMIARFAPLLQQLGVATEWLVPPPLARLFAECLGVNAIAAQGTLEFQDVDFFVDTPDLPARFFPPLTQPPAAPYLRSPPPRHVPGARIGVVTHGYAGHENDANRSLPHALRDELLGLPGAVSLKPEDTGARDFYETAQLVAGLDLVISVDTSVAHLAGAMGKPVWILLPARDTDWRWMTNRSDSPWYPTARLFRQGVDEDWRPVLQAVRAELLRMDNARVGCRTEMISR